MGNGLVGVLRIGAGLLEQTSLRLQLTECRLELFGAGLRKAVPFLHHFEKAGFS